MQYTQKELSKLVADVERAFTAELVKAEEGFKTSLSKAEDEKEAPKTDEKEQSEESEEPKDEKEQPEHEEATEDESEHEEKPEETQDENPAEAEQEHEEQDQSGCDYDEQDMEHMHKMYSSMSPGELKAHHDSVRQALDSHSAPPQEEMHEMGKSEKIESIEVKPEIIKANADVEILKSEVAATKAENEELKKSLEAVTAFITKMVGQKPAPQAKAITHVEALTKNEGFKEEKELSKSEVDQILNKKAASPNLAKSDRDAINAFYLNKTSINTISHLLKT